MARKYNDNNTRPQGTAATRTFPIILEEDEFTSKLDSLVERKYFPDLSRLRTENDELEGRRSIGNGTSIIMVKGTPATVRKGVDSLGNSNDDVEMMDFSTEENPMMGIDEFLNANTSEDNASFRRLLDSENKMREDKYQRIFDTGPKSNMITGKAEPKLIGSGRNGHESNKTMAGVETWKYTARNALMFHPPDLSMSPSSIAHQNKAGGGGSSHDGWAFNGKQKLILHQNTRLPDPDILDNESVISFGSAGSLASIAGYKTPTIKGYKLIDPPTPLSSGSVNDSGPVFRINPTPRREAVALRLASKSKVKHSSGSARSGGVSKRKRSGAISSGGSMDRMLLSPSAQRLLNMTRGGAGSGLSNRSSTHSSTPSRSNGVDMKLRSSYNSPYVFRPY